MIGFRLCDEEEVQLQKKIVARLKQALKVKYATRNLIQRYEATMIRIMRIPSQKCSCFFLFPLADLSEATSAIRREGCLL